MILINKTTIPVKNTIIERVISILLFALMPTYKSKANKQIENAKIATPRSILKGRGIFLMMRYQLCLKKQFPEQNP